RREIRVTLVTMLTAGVLSFFMNNIAVVALMLPVVIDVTRRTRIPASRLLMPLAQGTLLGGMSTLVATAANLLVSNALATSGFEPFGIFDFAPLGFLLLAAGILFVTLAGRRLLPRRKPEEQTQRRSQRNLRMQYGLKALNFEMRIAPDSMLVGKTLAESRIGSAAGLIVLALERYGRTEIMPPRQIVLQGGDKLHVQGRLDRFQEFRRWSELVIEREAPVLQGLMAAQLGLVEVTVAEGSPLDSALLDLADFRNQFHANVLAIRRADSVRRVRLAHVPLKAGDVLLLQTHADNIAELERSSELGTPRKPSEQELNEVYRLQERTFVVRVPRESALAGDALSQNRLSDAFDFRLLAIFREGELEIMPSPDKPLRGGDLLLLQGREEDLDVLRGLQELEIEREGRPSTDVLDSERLGMVEATMHPRSKLVGQPVPAVGFREKYGLELAAVWRNGHAIRVNLEQLVLQLGDALLLLGPRDKLRLLERDQDFLLLTPLTQRIVDSAKAPIAGAIMIGVILSAFLGWLPIHIAALIGATLMVVFNCLTMEEAYRAIDWRSIFLIAGLLPLGTALDETGAAHLITEQTIGLLGHMGPWWVIAGLYVITVLGNLILPGAAIVVLMSPIAISASSHLGVAPQTAMMAVAIGASSGFMSPVSHPAFLLIMGPGGYRFGDYLKVGLPLTLLTFVVMMALLPWLWPLVPLPSS
ncbi:MAG TPA: SLC13 family permease, partial [Gammaproteobacteria bacterium]|nr:SLC13 family permease [Gammaproteobacteria bacterium]